MRPLTTRTAHFCASAIPLAQRSQSLARPLHHRFSSSKTPATEKLSPRWLSDVRARIGKCIMFGINDAQTSEAGSILQEVTSDWRELLAGSEGFLTGQEYRGLYRQEVVWGEMDSMGHVNNVMYNRYAESARVNWTLNFAAQDPAHKKAWLELMSPKSIGLILRSIKTDYKFPMKWPDRVTVLHKLRNKPEQGTDHFILDVVILSEAHRRAAARCIEDIVVYDYRSAKKSPLPPFMIDKFKKIFELQEQAKEGNSARVRQLLARVRDLEKGSWDRADAVEDLGSAAKP
ncbi:thioesterase-like superfamily-domain-containing protein [Boeremia exigua]|uniref:thioesterase-like superfamily-domain-containing protein n=1 Tax=Boeremia exigua TaxID=749465 RepID=UPI001E8DE199|nr:thioesterase-like superfamily-domain-containing protein [Boeremia exigua]KAH6637621.1 thioesterase-like superfamily-domain-containing protein [Boeremia exigua]